MIRTCRLVLFAVAALALAAPALAQDPMPPEEGLENVFPAQEHFSPYAGRDFPDQVYWGDTHLHTGMSMDAGAFGARLLPEDAYRFARGEELTASTGLKVRLSRPLDFLVVADHSDNMGFFPRLFAGEPEMLADETGRRWYDLIQSGDGVTVAQEVIARFSNGTFPEALSSVPGTAAYRNAWDLTIDAAEKYNDPGTFTAFIGYEWTSNTMGNNLHRVVILRDDATRARLVEPFTTVKPLGSDNPRDLWVWLQNYEDATKGQALAIAHNGNLSNGIMFPLQKTVDGKKVDRQYAATRARWEPLYEVTQIKGDGETHPFLSPNDEFADYETWDQGNLDLTVPKEDGMLEYEYARSALGLGLMVEQKTGVNPYRFGMIGSTDSHTGLATAQEDNFFGKHSGSEPSPERWSHPMAKFGDAEYTGWGQVASGLAAVWAPENTRGALFDAMQRKETYATTGSRITVRFFGGWDFSAADAQTRLPGEVGYAKGVPMGGTLPRAEGSGAPTFLVAARKDALSGNLDRIQIVKVWLEGKDGWKEKVYDVVWSGDRQPGPDGKLPPVGNTVDVAKASWTNSIGSPELIGAWSDRDFDAAVPALYYARVIEIPTPRWTAYEAARFGITMSDEVPMTTTERAYTSPIWYDPPQE